MTAVLTPEQIEQFNTEGYVTPVRIMDVAEAGTLRSKLEATEAARGGKLAPTERSKAHMLFKWLDDLIRDPRVLDPIEQLIGPNILCWNTLFWIKEAQSPSFVSWHQDTKYWGLSTIELSPPGWHFPQLPLTPGACGSCRVPILAMSCRTTTNIIRTIFSRAVSRSPRA